jgi:HlyD family secretion protein
MNNGGKPTFAQLSIPAELKARPGGRTFLMFGGVLGVFVILFLVYFFAAPNPLGLLRATPASPAKNEVVPKNEPPPSLPSSPPSVPSPASKEPAAKDVVLTATGYIVARERIELGPKLAGTVVWIQAEKGDRVKKGQLLAKLDDAEYRARFLEATGRLALAEADLKNAQVTHQRQVELTRTKVGTDQALDDAVRALDVAKAQVQIAQGQLALAETWLKWCRIESPLDGVVLKKYVDADELVIPQAFGGPNHPSTLLVALADLNDLQVEIDVNELDTPKVQLHQRCRIRPEAYRDKVYQGYVQKVSPEADRNKGTLQVKVHIENPDQFLVPELNARVDFLLDRVQSSDAP